jgi:hypothetical protein
MSGAPDTKKQAEVRYIIRGLLTKGIKPTPTELAKWGVPTAGGTSGGPTLRGDLARIRQEEFEAAGWERDKNGRWEKRSRHHA